MEPSQDIVSLAAFKQSEYFAVHVLSADQEPLSNLFATRGADKFADIDIERGHGGTPLLPGCAVRFQRRTASAYEGGDHQIFVGDVLDFDDFKRAPLNFQGGSMHSRSRSRLPSAATTDTSDLGASFTKDYLGNLLSVANLQLKARLRPALEAHGLDEEDYTILSLLIIWDHRDAAEIDGLLQIAGKRLRNAKVRHLTQRNLMMMQVDVGDKPACR